MPGFDNNVVYSGNVDFSGSTSVTKKITTDGQLLIGSTVSPNIKVGTLTAGTGIMVVNGSGSITVNAKGGALTYNANFGSMTINNTYAPFTLPGVTLPAISPVGSAITLVGNAGFYVAQLAGQRIFFGSSATTLGIAGSLISSDPLADCVEMICLVANTTWYVKSSVGNIIVI